jgi:hypothetical protein
MYVCSKSLFLVFSLIWNQNVSFEKISKRTKEGYMWRKACNTMWIQAR